MVILHSLHFSLLYDQMKFIFSTPIDGKRKAWLYSCLGSRVDYDAEGLWCITMAYSADVSISILEALMPCLEKTLYLYFPTSKLLLISLPLLLQEFNIVRVYS